MLTFAELCEKVASGTVMLRGSKRAVRPITALEAQRVRRAYPRPPEPLAGPGGPSAALLAAYEASATEWGAKMQILEAAIGLDYQTKGGLVVADCWGDPPRLLAWAEAAWTELGGVLSESEVRLVLDAMRATAVGSVEEAAKNS